jgi:hypothetical protein
MNKKRNYKKTKRHRKYKTRPNKTNKTNKTNRTNKKRQFGKGILGIGKDGCIVDSIICNELDREKYVAKMLYDGKTINTELNDALKRLDPTNERFNYYIIPDESTCVTNEEYDTDIRECSTKGRITRTNSNLVFQKKLAPLDETKLTREQYRHLRKSLQILDDNGLTHGDLPGNVMLNPDTNLPVIIDWEEAKMNADALDKQIDYNAFLEHFKIK